MADPSASPFVGGASPIPPVGADAGDPAPELQRLEEMIGSVGGGGGEMPAATRADLDGAAELSASFSYGTTRLKEEMSQLRSSLDSLTAAATPGGRAAATPSGPSAAGLDILPMPAPAPPLTVEGEDLNAFIDGLCAKYGLQGSAEGGVPAGTPAAASSAAVTDYSEQLAPPPPEPAPSPQPETMPFAGPAVFPATTGVPAYPGAEEAAEEAAEPAPRPRAADWRVLNQLLRDAGFAGVPLRGEDGTAPSVDAARDTLDEVLRQYERRGRLVQELLAGADMSRAREERTSTELRRLRSELEGAKGATIDERRRRQEVSETSTSETKAASEELKKARTAEARMTQKASQLEHQLRARERQLQKLQDKLEEKVRAEERRAVNNREALERLRRAHIASRAGQGPSPGRDMKAAEVVALYEAEREKHDAERIALQAEVRTLGDELCARENLISRKDRAGGWRTPDEGELLRHRAEAERERDDAMRERAGAEARAADAQRELRRQLAEAERRATSLAEENANLILELEARPTPRDLRDAQKRADTLASKLARALSSGRGGGGDEYDDSDAYDDEDEALANRLTAAPLQTRDRMRRDKELHRLQLHRLERLPRDVIVDALQDVCRQLELTDPALIPGSIAKLQRVVATVPKLERFVGETCDVVFGAGAAYSGDQAVNRSPQAVPGILKGWADSLRSLAELREFRTVLQRELHKRATGGAREGATPAELAVAVRDLVEMERAHLLTKANFQNAEAALQSEPDRIIHKVIAHFQHLFEVSSLEGVLPRMNQVYTQTTESRNFMRVLRQLLGLDPSANVNMVLHRVRQILDSEAESLDLKKEYWMGRPRVADGQAPMDDPEGPTAVHVRTVGHLVRLFGLADATRVVPHVEKMFQRLKKMEDTLPRYQTVLTELYDLLRVVSIDEVVPSVRVLIGLEPKPMA